MKLDYDWRPSALFFKVRQVQLVCNLIKIRFLYNFQTHAFKFWTTTAPTYIRWKYFIWAYNSVRNLWFTRKLFWRLLSTGYNVTSFRNAVCRIYSSFFHHFTMTSLMCANTTQTSRTLNWYMCSKYFLKLPWLYTDTRKLDSFNLLHEGGGQNVSAKRWYCVTTKRLNN
jgi:hypothetical protein